MTHYIKTVFSDKTLCGRVVYEVLRSEDDTTPILNNIDCPKCIIELENIILKLKNRTV